VTKLEFILDWRRWKRPQPQVLGIGRRVEKVLWDGSLRDMWIYEADGGVVFKEAKEQYVTKASEEEPCRENLKPLWR
jgi:hypothetical protein